MSNWITALDGNTLPDRALIGGKAWSIARMIALGLPVPPAFVVTTRACNAYLANGTMPDGLEAELHAAMQGLEAATGRTFGRGDRPLLVSVRSGAPISMPGMMDTVLNLGISTETGEALGRECVDPAFAADVHHRFRELYASVVVNADHGVTDPAVHLIEAVKAVFESWNSRRARRYRSHHGIPDDLGTAVTIQAMVFGNLDAASGTGVLFSRNPLSGERLPYGEFLARAQGEDVVSGKFTPEGLDAMHRLVPDAHDALLAASDILERENAEMQDIEFTVQSGKLFLLQSRTGKRAPPAAVRIAVDMCEEGLIDRATALGRVTAEQAHLLLAPRLAEGAAEAATLLASGEAACPGVGVGVIVTDSDEAESRAQAGEQVVLARPTTSPEDVHGMLCAKAVITETGGSTSHAAVVSRALGKPCIVGCGGGALDALKGRTVTVDGSSGRIFDGALAVVAPDERADPWLAKLADWAREQVAEDRRNDSLPGLLSAIHGIEVDQESL